MPHSTRSTKIGLHHLRSVIVAADSGSFRQAAELLEVRHSVLSRSVRQFEQLVGVALFERSTGGVIPTPAGRSIVRMSRMVLEQVDALVTSGRSTGRGDAGRLSVGFCTSISTGNLRTSITEFRRRAPAVELATVERPPTELVNSLRSGRIDVAVVPEGITSPDQKSLPVWSERILILLPKDHRLAMQHFVQWTDLRGETLLVCPNDPRDHIEHLLVSKLFLKEARPKFERHDVSRAVLKGLVSMGLGFSLVTESDLQPTYAGIACRELQDGTGPSRIGFHAQWLNGNENPALKRFLSLLEERYPSPSPALLE